MLITEVSQSAGVDQMEITNLGPGSLDISCLVAQRTAANPAADETLSEVTMLPSLAPSVVSVGGTFVFDFSFDGGAAMGACYTISYAGTILDQVAVNGFVGCDVFTGVPNSGDVYRTCEADSYDAADWAEAELCYPLTIGMLNPDLEAMPDNGTQMGLQSIAPNMAMCVFKVTINDEEDPFCGELSPNTNSYTGGAISDVNAASCNRSVLTIPDDCIIGTLSLTINGTVTPANSTITLISPEGTEAVITSLPAMPEEFYTEKSGGDWILDIEPIGGPFTVNSWTIDIVCMDEFEMADVVLPNDPGLCGAEFTWTHPFFVDNCFEGTIVVDYSTLDADCTPPSGPLLGVGGYEVTEFFCVGTTTVTYTLTDESGNVHTCGFDVTVEDVEDPVVVCPDDITINLNSGECRRKVCFDPVLATDNCEVVDTVSVPESCSDFEIGTTTVTITVFDEAGNSAECMFDINIIEYVPDSYDLFCNDMVNVSLGPDCIEAIGADMILEGNDYHCYEDYEITITNSNGNVIATNPVLTEAHFGQTFTVTVYDPDSGNTCWGSIFVEDHQSPVIECPADLTVKCNDPQLPPYTGEPELLSCESGTTNFYNDVFEDYGACSDVRGQIIRTWTVTDDADNSSACVQTITIERVTFDDIAFPANLELDCAAVGADPTLIDPANTGEPTANGYLIGGSVLCGLSVKLQENYYPICEGSYDILRTWSVYDPCLPAVAGVNPITYIQVIKVIDHVGPAITCGPDLTVSTNGGLECVASVIIPPANITDACSSWTATTDTPNGTLSG
ncbi:MAG: HYR domain-containing protein, partial [Phaeodactylibacter sp.]|nr:HYR domain-containing protein [Phaeodactylibacter sp.]